MAAKVLQINIQNMTSGAEFEQAIAAAARPIIHTPGLRWKVWLLNEGEHEAEGIYLFNDEGSLQAFLAGPTVVRLATELGESEVSIKSFDTMGALIPIIRDPLRATASP